MGTFRVDVEIGGPDGREFVTINALVDTGASYTAVPASLLRRLGVQVLYYRNFELADGRATRLPFGVAKMRLSDEELPVYVVFAPDGTRPLLGATALEAFSLVVDPIRRKLVHTSALLMQAAATNN